MSTLATLLAVACLNWCIFIVVLQTIGVNLDLLTTASSSSKPRGIDFFSHNICEDQLIGSMLWRETSPIDHPRQQWPKHALGSRDIAIQPARDNITMSKMA
jgi:hypothetical protein